MIKRRTCSTGTPKAEAATWATAGATRGGAGRHWGDRRFPLNPKLTPLEQQCRWPPLSRPGQGQKPPRQWTASVPRRKTRNRARRWKFVRTTRTAVSLVHTYA